MKTNSIIRKVALFTSTYLIGLLVLQSSIVRSNYISLYNTAQEVVFNICHPTVQVDFETYTQQENSNFDYTVTLYDRSDKESPIAQINQGASKTAIVPFILLLGLLIIGPGNLKKKVLLGFLMALAILLVLAMKYTLLISQNAPQLDPLDGSIWISTSSFLQGIYRTHEALYILIVAIWLLLFWTGKDAKQLLSSFQ